MEFSAGDIAKHSENLNTIGDAAVDDLRTYCDNLFSGIDWSDADDASRKQIRNQVIDHVNYIQETYGSASESIGSLFFDNALSNDGNLVNAVMAGAANNQQVSNSVRYWARNLFGEEPDIDTFIDGVSAFVRRTVTHAGDLSVVESAVSANEQKNLGIRYARVPQGPTCAFCIMLASRGFVYASRESAGELVQYHDACNCRIVAGMPGTKIEGYDPDGMYDRYLECRKSITNKDSIDDNPIWQDWERLSQEDQASYADNTGGDAYNNYLAHRITQEMSTRDRQWLYDGTIPQYETEENAKPSDREKDTAKRLAEHGYRSRFRSIRDTEGLKTSDVFFISGKQGNEAFTEWDFKGVEGNGTQTIYHQFEEAAGQTKRVVIDLKNAGSRYNKKEYAIERTEKFIKYHYKIKTGKDAGSEWEFDEAIVLFKDGSIIKIAR